MIPPATLLCAGVIMPVLIAPSIESPPITIGMYLVSAPTHRRHFVQGAWMRVHLSTVSSCLSINFEVISGHMQTKIPWPAIQEAATNEALTINELAERFGVKAATIRRAYDRKKLVLVSKIIPQVQRRIAEKVAQQTIERKTDEWLARGERHRKVAFDLAHDSLKLMKPKAPRNFREAEAADKIARRAAGLDVSDTVQQTLININEAMDSSDEPVPVQAFTIPNEAPATPALPASVEPAATS
jgi:DNA-binding transcriptional regulator YhcF (GntR family)